jgi:hypothetical protein
MLWHYGLTEEHQQSIKSLENLMEINLYSLTAIKPEGKASRSNAEIIRKLKPPIGSGQATIKISQVETPEGEDINSLSQSVMSLKSSPTYWNPGKK